MVISSENHNKSEPETELSGIITTLFVFFKRVNQILFTANSDLNENIDLQALAQDSKLKTR